MDPILILILITLGSGGVGYVMVQYKEVNFFFGLVGAFFVIGALGGLAIFGFVASMLVFHFVSKYTFDLLGYIVAAPVLLGPLWFVYWMLSGSNREYDGRGFGDGSGGM